MYVETHNKLTNPNRIEATRVIIKDNHGNILLVALELDTHHILLTQRGDPNFNSVLKSLGLPDNVTELIFNPGTDIK